MKKNKIMKILILFICLFGIREVKAENNLIGKYFFDDGNVKGWIIINDDNMQINSEQNIREEWRAYEKTTGTYAINGTTLTYIRNCEGEFCTNELGGMLGKNEVFIIGENAGLKTLSFSNEYALTRNLLATKNVEASDQSNDVLNKFRSRFYKKIKNLLKDGLSEDSIQFECNADTSGSNSGDQYMILHIFSEKEDVDDYSIIFTATKDNIIKYKINQDYIESNGKIKDFKKVFMDGIILSIVLETIAEEKGYDLENFGNWSSSLTDEQLNKLNLENDGISLKIKTIVGEDKNEHGSASYKYTYFEELNIDLENGIKAYNSNIKYTPIDEDNIFDEIEKDKETLENNSKQPENSSNKKEDKNIPNNPGTGSFISLTLMAIIASLGAIVFYYSKKKNKIFKI